MDGVGGAALRLSPLDRDESATASYRLPANRRGTITFGPMTAQRRDPFGLAVTSKIVAGTAEIVVLPTHHRLHLPTNASGSGPLGNLLRVRSLTNSGSEFRSLRDYNPGDDLRTVSWRASARSDNLLVRELEPDSLRRCTVFLDLEPDQYDEEGFERAVSAAASVVVTVAHAGLDLRVVIGSKSDLRNTNAASALRELADCAMQVSSESQTAQVKTQTGEGLGLIIVVTGSPRSPLVERTSRSVSAADVLLIVACTTMTSASQGIVLDATAADMFQTSWESATGRVNRVLVTPQS